MKEKYLHGFSSREQKRLLHQAKFLEPYVFKGIDFSACKNLLEIGSGVGAQTQIICQKFPKLEITSVDLSELQIESAKKTLKREIADGKVIFSIQDAQNLKLQEKYDSAFICWFLEHVPSPLSALKSVRKQLKSGAKIYCTEVFNQTLFMQPYSPSYIKYWSEFNDFQFSIHGHPFIGVELGNLLKNAGFIDIKLEMRPLHFDSRAPKTRKAFIDYFFNILLSAEGVLLREKRVDRSLIVKMNREVEIAKKTADSVFFYAFMRAVATAP